MSKHTPGPWIVGDDGDMIWGTKWKGSHVLVANVPFTKDPRVEADARLIAAAPELLEALVRLEAELVDDKYSEDYEPSPFENLAIDRAAIAKATGE